MILRKTRLSLRSFISVALVAICLYGAIAISSLWYSMDHSTEATRNLAEGVESLASLENLQKNLNIHRRQALLTGIADQSARKFRVEESKKEMLAELDNFYRYVSSPEEGAIVRSVRDSVLSYLANYEAQRARGVRSEALYEDASKDYYRTQEAIQDLINFNLNETLVLQSKVKDQNRWSYVLIASSSFLLAVVIGTLLFGLRSLLFKPVVELKKRIEGFEVGQDFDAHQVQGASEIQSIASGFEALASKLSKQKEQQLLFISAVAHDLKNPLGAIKMSAEIMTERPDLSDTDKEMLAIIGRQSNHLQRLVSDLLDTSRMEAGHIEMHFEPHDLRTLIQDSVALHSNLSSAHQISLKLPLQPLMALCDEERLCQVLNNLLNNAIKYSPKGGLISVEARDEGEFATIHVKDSGIGILPEDLQGIFEPFRRSSSTRESIPGVGLGLSVSRKIIQAHRDGDIFVQSKTEEGSTFTIRLRLLKPAQDQLIQDRLLRTVRNAGESSETFSV